MKNSNLITRTADFNCATGLFAPCKRLNVNQRINYRAGKNNEYHYSMVVVDTLDNSHQARLDRYEVNCLENDVRPFFYNDKMWNDHLRDIASDEQTERNEAKHAWMYEV